MPRISGWSHLSLSVRDRDATVKWYQDVLGFKPLAVMDDQDGYVRTLLIHPSGVVLAFQQHDANAGEEFGPERTGLDHFGLAVETLEDLDGWAEHLAGFGVTQSPIAKTLFGSVLCFRDPDGLQLELFHSPLV
jgi:glyoxylase I family protein